MSDDRTVRDEAKEVVQQFVAGWISSGRPSGVLAETMVASGGAVLSLELGDDAAADLLMKVGTAILQAAGKEDGTRH